MYKILLILFLSISLSVYSKDKYTLQQADSITYDLFISGKWDRLINEGNKILSQQIDFKTLRQRIAYAQYMKGDYYESRYQYEKAYSFDPTDIITISYLYYNGLCIGDEQYALYFAQKFPAKILKSNHVSKNRFADAIDCEYNYKTGYSNREAPNYYRIGLNSQLGFRFNLYQTLSHYSQSVETDTKTIQNEYFATLTYSMTAKLGLQIAYHYLGTKSDSISYPGNVFSSSVYYRINRFDVGISGSFFNNDFYTQEQMGLHGNVTLPGKNYIRFKSSLYYLIEAGNGRMIFLQSAGFVPIRKFWLEGTITFGNLKNFVDKHGLYVYNSLDPTTFRAGISLFYTIKQKNSLFLNYTFDDKTITATDKKYYQHSLSTGIIWKL